MTFAPRNDTSKPVILGFDMATIININADPQTTSNTLDDLHLYFADDLSQVEATLSTHLSSAASLIPEVSDHIICAGGKRLRLRWFGSNVLDSSHIPYCQVMHILIRVYQAVPLGTLGVERHLGKLAELLHDHCGAHGSETFTMLLDGGIGLVSC